MSKMREAWFGVGDRNPTLRELVVSDVPVEYPRTEAEDRVTALLPGDDLSNHFLYSPPNPFLNVSGERLLQMALDKNISVKAKELALAALRAKQQ